jgi:hypothetical protein
VECPDEENGFPPGGDNTTDSEKTSYKRGIKSATGTNPDFGAQMIQFPTLQGVIEELTFVRYNPPSNNQYRPNPQSQTNKTTDSKSKTTSSAETL